MSREGCFLVVGSLRFSSLNTGQNTPSFLFRHGQSQRCASLWLRLKICWKQHWWWNTGHSPSWLNTSPRERNIRQRHSWPYFKVTVNLTCKRGSVGQSEGLSIPRSSVRFRLKPDTSNSHEFELHRPSNKGTKLLLKVIKAIIIISTRTVTQTRNTPWQDIKILVKDTPWQDFSSLQGHKQQSRRW